MDKLQREAQSLIKRGKKEEAIKCYDRAIGRASSVQLLDERAACYEAKGDLDAALKDAKKAIQLKREDATGYLCAGRVLTKMQKESTALEVYRAGLKAIKHVGKGYEVGTHISRSADTHMGMLHVS